VKIIFLSNATYSLPAIHFFNQKKMIEAVVSAGKVNKHNFQVEQGATLLNVPFKRFEKNELPTEFKTWLTEAQPDLVLVFGCGYKIPAELLSIPKFGFYNIHFSLLPAYKGRNPVFWQIKNGENKGGITIHKMAKDFDTGPILVQQELSIFPSESHGLLTSRFSGETIGLISRAIEKLETNAPNMLREQDKNAASDAPEPSVNDLTIDWEKQSAREIENLVNASNPDYGGAVTLFRGQPFRVLEVTPAELGMPPQQFSPGTIVHSDTNYGVFVICSDQKFLRVSIIQISEGIISSTKLSSMGIKAGERFENAAGLQGFVYKP
jgi:methionyl-tRNA formyltransferase